MRILPIGLLVSASLCLGQRPSAREILDRVDQNLSATTRVVASKMVIHGERGSRIVESKTWAEGEEKSFTEFTAPAPEKGTKMLKLEDVLWMYSPSTDRTIQIAGHLLRQSVMGSDLSYEDMMEDPRLADHHDAEIVSEDTIDGSACWVLDLTAPTSDVAYHSRKVWVDREKYIPRKEELYAKSGKLLKQTQFMDIRQVQGRWYPERMVFKDMLKPGEGTEFIVETIEFDVAIPPHIFSKAA